MATCKKVSNVTAMKTVAINWTQLSVGWLLLLQLLMTSRGDSASQTRGNDGLRPRRQTLTSSSSSSSSSVVSSSQQRQHVNNDFLSITENCTAREVIFTLLPRDASAERGYEIACRPSVCL